MMLRELLLEGNITRAELYHRGDAQHLKTLIDLVKANHPFELTTSAQQQLGASTAIIAKTEIKRLEPFLKNIEAIRTSFPAKLKMIVNGKLQDVSLGSIEKTKVFTGRSKDAEIGTFNTGHIAELCMGLSVTTKFSSYGAPITVLEVLETVNQLQSGKEDKNYVFRLTRSLRYPERGSKTDTLNFLARVPGISAEAFLNMIKSKRFDSKVQAVLASAVAYVNESAAVRNSIERVRKDPNNNVIDIVSDGTTDSKGTKADLVLAVDGSKVNLLSLKTYSTDTLGQISGVAYENLNKWFKISFGLNLAAYKNQFSFGMLDTKDKAKRKAASEKIYAELLKFYDNTVAPFVINKIEKQSPQREAAIVKQLAQAALYHSRGEKLEDVEIIKLDDKISTGGYKVLKFSDDIVEAMQRLDLDVRYLNKDNSRTIQIFAVDALADNIDVKPIKLCQFRTTKMGGYPRNYFETGPMLEKLTMVGQGGGAAASAGTATPAKSGSLRKSK